MFSSVCDSSFPPLYSPKSPHAVPIMSNAFSAVSKTISPARNVMSAADRFAVKFMVFLSLKKLYIKTQTA